MWNFVQNVKPTNRVYNLIIVDLDGESRIDQQLLEGASVPLYVHINDLTVEEMTEVAGMFVG
jgi:hypothetical protein